MKCYIGLGSNLGNRKDNLEQAAQRLRVISADYFRASPVYSTPALVPEGAPDSWRISFLNAVIEMDWNDTASSLLSLLKTIEQDLGRKSAPRWAPRIVDLDLLLFGKDEIKKADLRIPHSGLWDRSFVLDPLKHLAPLLQVPGFEEPILSRARKLSSRSPLWMGILNLTPDSFSDGGLHTEISSLEEKINLFEKSGIQMLDLGAESTRPGAKPLSANEEYDRLKPALEFLQSRYRNQIFHPWMSVDTRHAKTAAAALEMGVQCINDVSGGADPQMWDAIRKHTCDYVLMHSLSIPADPTRTLSEKSNPVFEIKTWLEKKLEGLAQAGIGMERVIFDPGLGFGKTPQQSIEILRHIHEFLALPLRILVGHSRKSFIKQLNAQLVTDRDPESIGISLQMASQGVDILRVHEAHIHARAYHAFSEVKKCSL